MKEGLQQRIVCRKRQTTEKVARQRATRTQQQQQRQQRQQQQAWEEGWVGGTLTKLGVRRGVLVSLRALKVSVCKARLQQQQQRKRVEVERGMRA
jgi:hypothetical protein